MDAVLAEPYYSELEQEFEEAAARKFLWQCRQLPRQMVRQTAAVVPRQARLMGILVSAPALWERLRLPVGTVEGLDYGPWDTEMLGDSNANWSGAKDAAGAVPIRAWMYEHRAVSAASGML